MKTRDAGFMLHLTHEMQTSPASPTIQQVPRMIRRGLHRLEIYRS